MPEILTIRLAALCTVLLVCIGVAACSGDRKELGVGKARDMIAASSRYTAPKVTTIEVGEDAVMTMWKDQARGSQKLQEDGLIEFKLLRAAGEFGGKAKVTLTEQGMQYARPAGDRENFLVIELCKRRIVGVSAIERLESRVVAVAPDATAAADGGATEETLDEGTAEAVEDAAVEAAPPTVVDVALVEYGWQYVDTTPFGRQWSEDCRKRRAGTGKITFLNDGTGWRIEE